MAKEVPVGVCAEFSQMVEHRHTLNALDPDLPLVLATPWMIGWMEHACFEAQKPFCDEGEVTVGTAIHVDHRAPTTVGEVVNVKAVLERIDGRFFIFRVSASNTRQPIGSGTVHRAVVNVAKFMEKTSSYLSDSKLGNLRETRMSTSPAIQDLSYPIGKFAYSNPMTKEQRVQAIDAIERTPAKMRAAVKGLTKQQLDTPYRPGGWTVRQVVHHVPDSHANAFIRTKLALTENQPPIKPYDEKRWAELADTRLTPIETSLSLLEAIHERWNYVLRDMKDADFDRTLSHPEHGVRTLDWLIALYAWHGQHHVVHITRLREREGW